MLCRNQVKLQSENMLLSLFFLSGTGPVWIVEGKWFRGSWDVQLPVSCRYFCVSVTGDRKKGTERSSPLPLPPPLSPPPHPPIKRERVTANKVIESKKHVLLLPGILSCLFLPFWVIPLHFIQILFKDRYASQTFTRDLSNCSSRW